MRRAWRHLASACAAALLSSGACAAPASYVLDPAGTKVYWEVRHFGTSTHRGRFDRASGSVTLDREARRGEASIIIDTASVSSGVPVLDNILRSRSFLAAVDDPNAYFVAKQLRFDGDRLAEIRGEFTLHGASQPLSLVATSFGCRVDIVTRREICAGDFEAEIKRSDFGITYGLPFVGDAVKLLVSVEGVRTTP